MNDVIHINPKDNLVTCLRSIEKGETIEFEGEKYTANVYIPKYHKMSTSVIKKGEYAYKYGQIMTSPQRERIGDKHENHWI